MTASELLRGSSIFIVSCFHPHVFPILQLYPAPLLPPDSFEPSVCRPPCHHTYTYAYTYTYTLHSFAPAYFLPYSCSIPSSLIHLLLLTFLHLSSTARHCHRSQPLHLHHYSSLLRFPTSAPSQQPAISPPHYPLLSLSAFLYEFKNKVLLQLCPTHLPQHVTIPTQRNGLHVDDMVIQFSSISVIHYFHSCHSVAAVRNQACHLYLTPVST